MGKEAESEQIDFRPMTAEDAVGLVDLVRATYGPEYPHEQIYRPAEFFAAQERGEHISEVAVAAGGQVVGHWAFVFHGPKVAESAMTVTHPEFRGRGIAVGLEENLLGRIRELGVSWIMGEPVLLHTATQEMVLNHWKDGAITGFRLNAFHHVDAVTGFGEEDLEVGRVSVATGFGPIAEMDTRTVWLAPPYARILSLVLGSTKWPRSIGEGDGAGDSGPSGESVVEASWDEENASLRLDAPVIGADFVEAIRSARDDAIGRGARHIDLLLPVSQPESASVDLLPLGFSYAAFLPEMGWEGDLLLLQWLADPDVDRDHWHLANPGLETLADAVIAQARSAAQAEGSRP